jgi:predicted molibdopterin-dependent oxidoreductase YjgC
MGAKDFNYENASQVMEEIASVMPSYGGITYQRLEEGSLQWPCSSEDHPGTCILHTELFSRGKGHFVPLQYRPPAEMPDDEYPLVLTTDRSLFHFHTGTMTRKVEGLNIFHNEELVAISPADAAELGIADGDTVRVFSRRGDVTAKAKITERAPKGTIAMTFHFAETPTNEITNPVLDPICKIPELKVAAVRVEKVNKIAAGKG